MRQVIVRTKKYIVYWRIYALLDTMDVDSVSFKDIW